MKNDKPVILCLLCWRIAKFGLHLFEVPLVTLLTNFYLIILSYLDADNKKVARVYRSRLMELLSIDRKEANKHAHARYRSLKTVETRSHASRLVCLRSALRSDVSFLLLLKIHSYKIPAMHYTTLIPLAYWHMLSFQYIFTM